MGIIVDRICSLRDGPEAASFIEEAIRDYQLVIITGGLGPTADDITREAVARAAGVETVFQNALWEDLQSRYGLSKAKANRRQAQIPRGFHPVRNNNGTAPGFWGSVNGSMVCALPGPPRELQPMFFETLQERIGSFFQLDAKEFTELSTFLIPEAVLEDVCAEKRVGDVQWRTRFQPNKISLYLEGGDVSHRAAFAGGLRERFGEDLVREGNVEAFELLHATAGKRGVKIAAAESCTGGLFAALMTDLPGSSEIFWGSVVSYDNEAKMKILGVDEELLRSHGAVSREVAEAMATGLRDYAGTEYSLAISGIAGPSGGSEEKPVGTVCFSVAGEEFGVRSWLMNLGTRRQIVRRRGAVCAALLVEKAIRDFRSLDRLEKWNYS